MPLRIILNLCIRGCGGQGLLRLCGDMWHETIRFRGARSLPLCRAPLGSPFSVNVLSLRLGRLRQVEGSGGKRIFLHNAIASLGWLPLILPLALFRSFAALDQLLSSLIVPPQLVPGTKTTTPLVLDLH